MAYQNLKPSPIDDRTPSGHFDQGGQNGSADDDDAAIRPFLRRLLGRMAGTYIPRYPNRDVLDGPHFRVGYQGYNGVSDAFPMQRSAGDSTIGEPIIMRPPIIPRRSASPLAVRNAINFVQSMPYETWEPIIPPPVSRR